MFKDMVKKLHPGYKLPNRKEIAGPLLDDVYDEFKEEAKLKVRSGKVCFCIDGWTNVAHDAVIGMSIQHEEDVFLVKCVD